MIFKLSFCEKLNKSVNFAQKLLLIVNWKVLIICSFAIILENFKIDTKKFLNIDLRIANWDFFKHFVNLVCLKNLLYFKVFVKLLECC
jgi:hypothetical protein